MKCKSVVLPLILVFFLMLGGTFADDMDPVAQISDQIESQYGIVVIAGPDSVDFSREDDFMIDAVPVGASPLLSLIGSDRTAEKMQIVLEALQHYPDDMFLHFADYGGNLRIICCGNITDLTYPERPAGFFCFSDGWFDLFLNLSVYSEPTVHHELWHAFEYLIMLDYPDAFDPNTWADLNPPEFTYTGDEIGFRDDVPFADYLLPGDDAWFIRDYSLVDAKEDRATIYALLFSGDYPPDWWKTHPHLLAKLSRMNEYLMLVAHPQGVLSWND